jgi:hypothetical protein
MVSVEEMMHQQVEPIGRKIIVKTAGQIVASVEFVQQQERSTVRRGLLSPDSGDHQMATAAGKQDLSY